MAVALKNANVDSQFVLIHNGVYVFDEKGLQNKKIANLFGQIVAFLDKYCK